MSMPAPGEKGEADADDQRETGHDLEIDERLDPDPADLAQVARARDAVDDDANTIGPTIIEMSFRKASLRI